MVKPLARDSLRLRLLTSVIGIPLLVLVLWTSAPGFAALTAIIAALAIAEFCRLSPVRLSRFLVVLAMATGALFILDAAYSGAHRSALITFAVLAPFASVVLLPPDQRSAGGWAWAVAGIFYIGWTLSLAAGLRFQDQGQEWLLAGIGTTFAIDTAAYFTGKAFGKRKLAPTISPGKTWEGSVGGFIAGGIAMAVLAHYFRLMEPLWSVSLLGLILGAVTQLGDLAESMLKRSAGTKDAGTLVPGHGGLLDRLDSLLPAFAVLYFFATYLK